MTGEATHQPVDDAARRQAKELLRTERHGALAVLDPIGGAPLASRVSVATDAVGAPILLISQLSAHFGALEVDPRCSLLLGSPGKGDPLAHPRLTVMALAEKLEGAARDAARARFLARHPKAELYTDFGDFAFWRLNPERAALNGGFAKAYNLRKEDVLAPEIPGLAEMEANAVAHMNADHADAVKLYAEVLAEAAPGDWRLATLDAEGMELTCGDEVARLWFDPPLTSSEELRPRLVALAKAARG